MNLWIEAIIIIIMIGVTYFFVIAPLYYADATPKTYNFTNCHKSLSKNNIFYYCYGNPPHQRSILYLELENP